MIILDTNVVSEILSEKPDHNVISWMDAQASETLFLTSITVAELLFGIAVMPQGRRKNSLSATIEGVLVMFSSRTLAFDSHAARKYAELAAMARSAGRGFPAPDAFIASIASLRGYAIATRDESPFEAVGLAVINPWTHHSA